MKISKNIKENMDFLSQVFQIDVNFDLLSRNIKAGGRDISFYFLDGFVKDVVFEKILEFILKIEKKDLENIKTIEEFADFFIPYMEIDITKDMDALITAILSGTTAFFIDGLEGAIIIDIRTYPQRSIQEPEKDRVMRGSHEGFVETMVVNTALLRRRIRDPHLKMEHCHIGKKTKIDVVVSYLDDQVDQDLLNKIKKKLAGIKTEGISMIQEGMAEALLKTSFFNPFPRIKYTERPDYAAACLMEGKIIIILDNTPAVMIFPCSLADFFKEADDYYFPPLTGSYLRISRIIISLATVFLTPLFLYFMNNMTMIPDWLFFIKLNEEAFIPIFIQLLILEFMIDGLRLASLNTPSNLSSTLGIIGGLLLSEFAIQAQWFSMETILYMAFVAIASYAQPSFEMGYALKFSRIFLLFCCQFFNLGGIIGGTFLLFLLLLCTKTMTGYNYLYPLIPFDGYKLYKIFFRSHLK